LPLLRRTAGGIALVDVKRTNPEHPDSERPNPERRFNVLLTQDRRHADEHWTQQLPRLLDALGVEAHLAQSGLEAIDLAQRLRVHAAVIDLATPMKDPPVDRPPSSPRLPSAGSGGGPGGAGLDLLQLFRRLPERPAVVVLRGPASSKRQAERLLQEMLRLGVFSVMDKPVEIEALLNVFRRLLDRRYRGAWPEPPPPAPPAPDRPDSSDTSDS
jgi:CheY-like chemotaxis protein